MLRTAVLAALYHSASIVELECSGFCTSSTLASCYHPYWRLYRIKECLYLSTSFLDAEPEICLPTSVMMYVLPLKGKDVAPP